MFFVVSQALMTTRRAFISYRGSEPHATSATGTRKSKSSRIALATASSNPGLSRFQSVDLNQ